MNLDSESVKIIQSLSPLVSVALEKGEIGIAKGLLEKIDNLITYKTGVR